MKLILANIIKFKWIILGLVIILWMIIISLSPAKFPQNYYLEIKDGVTIKQVSQQLKESGLIKSQSLFNVLYSMTGDAVIAGTYRFEKQQNIFQIVRRIAQGDFQIPAYNITFSEGMTVEEMAERIAHYIPKFDKQKFIELGIPKEGYLFPDTYKIVETIKPEELIKTLEETLYLKLAAVDDIIKSSKYSLSEIIIMASIVEKEATKETRQEVANILWKRIEEGLALQVDAPFVYHNGKNSFTLTKDDLRDDHDLNTYTRKGLIPVPISNPGLESILASAKPKPTENYYFITGNDGEMYFAKTYEEHKINIARFLR